MTVVECERPREPARGELRSVTADRAEQTNGTERVEAVGVVEQKQGEKGESQEEVIQFLWKARQKRQPEGRGRGKYRQTDRQRTPGPSRALSYFKSQGAFSENI